MSSTAARRLEAAGWERTLYAAATFSLLAGLVHLWVTPEHFKEWWGYGAFFLVAAAAQILYVPIVLLLPTRIVILLGIAGNLAIVVLYLLTRTVGIPFFGPEAGEVERVGFADVCATTSELGVSVALSVALLQEITPERIRTILLIVAVALVLVGQVVHLVLTADFSVVDPYRMMCAERRCQERVTSPVVHAWRTWANINATRCEHILSTRSHLERRDQPITFQGDLPRTLL